MATLIEQYTFWNNSIENATLRNRAAAAAMNAARDVLNEAVDTPNHPARVKWAASVFQDINAAGRDMVGFLAANAAIVSVGNNATDNDVQFVVNSSIDSIAAKFA